MDDLGMRRPISFDPDDVIEDEEIPRAGRGVEAAGGGRPSAAAEGVAGGPTIETIGEAAAEAVSRTIMNEQQEEEPERPTTDWDETD